MTGSVGYRWHLRRLMAESGMFATAGGRERAGWLFPGHPGRPLTASQLGQRPRALGIDARADRRTALTHLGAHLPAAVLADVTGIHPTTAVHWNHNTTAN